MNFFLIMYFLHYKLNVYYTKLVDYDKKTSIVRCRPTGDPWVPANPMGTGMDKILNVSWVWIFLMGLNIFHGLGFGTAKSSGFRPFAIPTWV
jgi:hypothetical protein